MPAAADVRPAAWDEIIVLYDDGVYSAIWGRFRRRRFKQIGVRWNEGDNPGGNGYPTMGKYAGPGMSSHLLSARHCSLAFATN